MSTIVFFDLETTELDPEYCHIIQLSAVCEGREFNAYIRPRRDISPEATDVTGFFKSRGRLYLHGTPVNTVFLYDALSDFINFLHFCCPQRPVLLAAHNASEFDAPILARVLRKCSLWNDFQQMVCGFVDTLLLSRNINPYMRRHRLTTLVKYFLRKYYNAHDAVEDARVLEELFNFWDPDERDISDVTFSTDEF